MKIILCYPPSRNYNGYGQDTQWLPLGIASIGAYLKNKDKDLDIVLLDLFRYTEKEALKEIRKHINDEDINIIGFTLLTEQRISVFDLCDKLKMDSFMCKSVGEDTNIITVVGGPHAFIMSKQIQERYKQIDHIIKGEGEKAFYNLIQEYKKDKKPNKLIQSENFKNLNDIPHAIDGFKLFKTDIKVNEAPIVFSRGCTDYCTFCSTTAFWKGYRSRRATNVFDEMLKWYTQYNCTYFKFHDDACTADIENLKDLCKIIIRFGYNKIWKFELTARADQFDDELIKLLHEADCVQTALGIESGNEQLRLDMNKRLDIDLAKENMKKLMQEGIKVHMLFIVGYVNENESTIQETVDFIREVKPNSYSAQPLMIFPGTKIYRDLVRKQWINDDYWWEDLPQPYYTRERSLSQLREWTNKILTAMNKKTIMMCACVRQDEHIFKLYIESLRKQEIDNDYYNVIKVFILHNSSHLEKYLDKSKNEVYLTRSSNHEYKKDEKTHYWSGNNFSDVVQMKNELINIAIENKVDYTFWVDSDLILHEKTLETLLKADKDIVSEIFWTKWDDNPSAVELPNCWDLDQYSFTRQPDTFREKGLYRVGMTGACTLIKQKVLLSGINWNPIKNISWSAWEDRAFCVKADMFGFEIWTDTHFPAVHLYRESELKKYLKDNNIESDKKENKKNDIANILSNNINARNKAYNQNKNKDLETFFIDEISQTAKKDLDEMINTLEKD
jgi:radical SAM superfamily enzyme YgiQ (UPF0313 family)